MNQNETIEQGKQRNEKELELKKLLKICNTKKTLSNMQRLILNDQTLTNLRVFKNYIEALCEALKVNQTLTVLDLSGNRIGAEEMQAFSESLKANQTLTHLDLSLNRNWRQGNKSFE
ncbi:leucine rich repeat family protein [Anaeramoeba flamelloides]|uniref:Leucine rich repeat family protein n=1 Tax=Anaeramoeba flamelloides TaxID=1746091 RepID=A0AAV7ZNT9_9EUKA|nr:leucine rich repeat family protein [Anaeramoeba flamelloides]